jgi:DNA-directed RNA polymerase specialized sigma24 family protein
VAGFSYREIMKELGPTYTNVNRRLVRGRKDLERAA